jgi:hypothetical protein
MDGGEGVFDLDWIRCLQRANFGFRKAGGHLGRQLQIRTYQLAGGNNQTFRRVPKR